MATIPGLRPVGQDTPNQRRKSGRTQVQTDTATQQLRPQASPVDTYVRPAEAPNDTRMLQMADALGQLSPSLSRLGNIWMEEKKGQATAEAEQTINEMTFEEAKAAVKSGQLPESDNPFFQRAFMRQYGTRLGLHASREAATLWENDFDKENGNIEEMLSERYNSDLEGIADENILKGYNAAFSPAADQLRATQAQYKSEQTRKHTLDGAYETMLAEAERGVTGGASAGQIHAAIRSHYEGNRELLNISNAEQDALVVQVAEKLAAEGHLDVVEQLLKDERGGIGSIYDKRGALGAAAAQAIATAEKVKLERDLTTSFDTRMGHWNDADQGRLNEKGLIDWHKANPGLYTDAQIQSLIGKSRATQERLKAAAEKAHQDSMIAMAMESSRSHVLDQGTRLAEAGLLNSVKPMQVINKQGEVDVMTAEEVIDATVDNYFTRMSPQLAQRNGETPEETLNREAVWASKNGVTNPEWERILNTGGSPAFMGSILSGEIPPNLEIGFDLYTKLRATSPALLERHFNDAAARDFYDTMRVAQEYGGLDFKKAATAAFNIHSDPETVSNPFMLQQFQDMEEAISGMGGFFSDWGKVDNASYASRELNKAARFYASRGLSKDKALEEATSRFKATHSFINGYAVMTNNERVPEALPEKAKMLIDQYARNHGEELALSGLTTGDITAVPLGDGSGAWMLVEGDTGNPLDAEEAMFTIADLDAVEAERVDGVAQGVADGWEPGSTAPQADNRLIPQGSLPTPAPHEGGSIGISKQEVDEKLSAIRPASESLRAKLDAGLEKIRSGLQKTTPHRGQLTADEMAIDAPEGSRTPALADITPAVQPDFIPVPKHEDPDVIQAVEKLKRAGITKEHFSQFNDNWALLKMGIHPTIREKLFQYLPSTYKGNV